MLLGQFFATFGSLLLILALVVPIPIRRATLPHSWVVDPSAPPICLELAYERAFGGPWLPSTLRLRTDTLSFDRRWLRAEGGPGERLYTYAGWRPAGPDSIEVAWHHSPILRLANRPDTLLGHATPSYLGPLFSVLEWNEFAVRGVRVQC